MDVDHIAQGKTDRRSFLVMMGSSVLGSFVLPTFGLGWLSKGKKDEPATAETAETGDSGEKSTRHVLRPATKMHLPDDDQGNTNRFALLWLESIDGKAQYMVWAPESPKVKEEAQRFYIATRTVYQPDPDLDRTPEEAAKIRSRKRSREELALCHRIAADPAADEPYLQYARYLKDKGDAQGEYIELCIAMDAQPNSPRWAEWDRRVTEIIADHAKQWFLPLACLGLRPMIQQHFFPTKWLRRGVIGRVEVLRPDVLPDLVDELFQAAPALHHLEIKFDELDVPGICACRQLRQLRTLRWADLDMDDRQAEAIARSPNLTGLKRLDIHSAQFGYEGAQALAESRLLAQLEALDFSHSRIPEDCLAVVLRSPQLTRLKELYLRNTAICYEPLEAIRERNWPLEVLNIGGNQMDLESLQGMLAETCRSLQQLDMHEGDLDGNDFAVCTEGVALPELKEWNLAENALDAVAIRRLKDLSLAPLEDLNLDRNQIGNAGVAELVTIPLPRLKSLDLQQNGLGDDAIQQLIRWPGLAQLEKLSLAGNDVTDAGVQALADSPRVGNLTELRFEKCPIGDEAARALAASMQLRRLRWLHLSGVSPEMEATLEERYPMVQVH